MFPRIQVLKWINESQDTRVVNATSKLEQPSIEWNCTFCSLPPLSDSFFEETLQPTSTVEPVESLSIPLDYIHCATHIVDTVDMEFKSLRTEYPKECIIASLNINSLQNKFVVVKVWLESNVFDILTLQETKIDPSYPNTPFHVEGNNLFRRDRLKGGAGVLVYVRDSIAATRRKKTGKLHG